MEVKKLHGKMKAEYEREEKRRGGGRKGIDGVGEGKEVEKKWKLKAIQGERGREWSKMKVQWK